VAAEILISGSSPDKSTGQLEWYGSFFQYLQSSGTSPFPTTRLILDHPREVSHAAAQNGPSQAIVFVVALLMCVRLSTRGETNLWKWIYDCTELNDETETSDHRWTGATLDLARACALIPLSWRTTQTNRLTLRSTWVSVLQALATWESQWADELIPPLLLEFSKHIRRDDYTWLSTVVLDAYTTALGRPHEISLAVLRLSATLIDGINLLDSKGREVVSEIMLGRLDHIASYIKYNLDPIISSIHQLVARANIHRDLHLTIMLSEPSLMGGQIGVIALMIEYAQWQLPPLFLKTSSMETLYRCDHDIISSDDMESD
jgi:hypothetical protein